MSAFYYCIMIIFMSNALAAEFPAALSIYLRHNQASLLSLICIFVICDTPEQISGGVIRILNTSPHSL